MLSNFVNGLSMNGLKDKCNCGYDNRYAHMVDGKQVYSCNKYGVCLPYDDLLTKCQLAERAKWEYEATLKYIIGKEDVQVFECKSMAKASLDIIGDNNE